ncbi:MAG: DsbA family protein [Rhodobacteraceae bacterium]|nr:DsbA family protein [Paracoccaceae bacterium]
MTIFRNILKHASALICAATFALPAAALDIEAMSDAERAAFRAEIRAYLLDNPEVLMEAIGVLEQREQATQSATDVEMAVAYVDQLHNDGYSWQGGNPDGDITIVEFMDYRCGYCRRAFTEVEELVATDGNIRIILKEFPILGEQSVLASKFAIAVQQLFGEDAYKDVHDALMVLRADITPASLTRLADAFGLNAPQILDHMESPAVAGVIASNRALGDRLQITGTPTFVMQDQMLRGYVPLDSMISIVADLRSNQG